VSGARRRRQRRLGRTLGRVAVVLITLALIVGGVIGAVRLSDRDSGGDDEPKAAPTPSSTPLEQFDTSSLEVARTGFCSRVAPAAVEEALGAPPESADSWNNGDRAEVADGVRDVVHEYGCSWTAADGRVAEAWVFAPPVARSDVPGLRRATAQEQGCRRLADAPAYGAGSVAVRCGRGSTAFHGLFGDAWLSCSLSGTDLGRTGRWCVTVAQAASA
jgi:hypothetical protein